jgi:hypothetical protein
METKTCTRCKNEKEFSEFRPKAGYKFGINSMCRPCEKEYGRELYHRDVEKSREYGRDKYSKDIMASALRDKLKNRVLKKNGTGTWSVLPYTAEELKKHLESQFVDGMSWDNYGHGEGKWNIDHIVPDSHFNYESFDDDGFLESWSLDNLRPLWSSENYRKSNKLMVTPR